MYFHFNWLIAYSILFSFSFFFPPRLARCHAKKSQPPFNFFFFLRVSLFYFNCTFFISINYFKLEKKNSNSSSFNLFCFLNLVPILFILFLNGFLNWFFYCNFILYSFVSYQIWSSFFWLFSFALAIFMKIYFHK